MVGTVSLATESSSSLRRLLNKLSGGRKSGWSSSESGSCL